MADFENLSSQGPPTSFLTLCTFLRNLCKIPSSLVAHPPSACCTFFPACASLPACAPPLYSVLLGPGPPLLGPPSRSFLLALSFCTFLYPLVSSSCILLPHVPCLRVLNPCNLSPWFALYIFKPWWFDVGVYNCNRRIDVVINPAVSDLWFCHM